MQGVVTYLRPNPIGSLERAGFFVQEGPTGPALFVASDPAGLEVSDEVRFAVTETSINGQRIDAAQIANLALITRGVASAATWTQELTNVADVVTAVASYENELATTTFTLDTAPTDPAANSFVKGWASTAAASGLRAVFQRDFADAASLYPGCRLTLTRVPLSRYRAEAQLIAWEPWTDITDYQDCAARLTSAVALNSTTVVVKASRDLDPSLASVLIQAGDGSSLAVIGAQVQRRTLTVTTAPQVPGVAYTVRPNPLIDVLGLDLDAGAAADFIGAPPRAAVVTAQTRVGNNVEDAAYLASGPYAGKIALMDFHEVVVLEPDGVGGVTRVPVLDTSALGLEISPRGMAYLENEPNYIVGVSFLPPDRFVVTTLPGGLGSTDVFVIDASGAIVDGPASFTGLLEGPVALPDGRIASAEYGGMVRFFGPALERLPADDLDAQVGIGLAYPGAIAWSASLGRYLVGAGGDNSLYSVTPEVSGPARLFSFNQYACPAALDLLPDTGQVALAEGCLAPATAGVPLGLYFLDATTGADAGGTINLLAIRAASPRSLAYIASTTQLALQYRGAGREALVDIVSLDGTLAATIDLAETAGVSVAHGVTWLESDVPGSPGELLFLADGRLLITDLAGNPSRAWDASALPEGVLDFAQVRTGPDAGSIAAVVREPSLLLVLTLP